MSTYIFLVALLFGAAGLAFWTYVRLPGLNPTGPRAALLHLLASGAATHLALPTGLGAIGPIDSRLSALAVVGVALPALTYLMLASLWLLQLARQLLDGYR